ncbi:MAG TPA: DUF151 domain-containing protein, partial [Kaistella sp.]|nr:DUF151 domain-containing protein [Kaistella sp.]
VDGVFFSNINFKNKENKEELIMDARTSDAVAMAVRFDAPIYTTHQVLNEAGILLELEDVSKEVEMDEPVANEGDLSTLSISEINKLLEDAVREEDFDAALELQKEIKRRNKKIE